MKTKTRLSDAEFESLKSSLNQAIHELVFAVQHLEFDEFDDASQCLVTAQGTIETVAERVVELEP